MFWEFDQNNKRESHTLVHKSLVLIKKKKTLHLHIYLPLANQIFFLTQFYNPPEGVSIYQLIECECWICQHVITLWMYTHLTCVCVCVLLQAKEADLLAIEQVLAESELDANKYRQWKSANVLLLEEISQKSSSVEETPSIQPEQRPSSTPAVFTETSLWEWAYII